MRKFISRLAIIASSLVLMLSFSVSSAVALPLITNGDFESGNLSGWTKTGTLTDLFSNGFESNWAVKFAGNGSLSQTSIVTAPGMEYTLSYMLMNSGSTNNRFGAIVDGAALPDLIDVGNFSYSPFSFNFVAGSSFTNIEFFGKNQTGAFSLDNVSMVNVPSAPVPEPSTLLLLGIGLIGASFLRKKMA